MGKVLIASFDREEDMSLTSFICWQKDRDRYSLKSKYTIKSGKNLITGRRTM